MILNYPSTCGTRLPPEWCEYIAQLCKKCEGECQIPLTVTKLENCPQTLLDSVGTPLMYLMHPVILWSPLEQFSMLQTTFRCPKCSSVGINHVSLHATEWRDGMRGQRSEPRKIYGEDTLLVGRVYVCTRGHEVVGYHPSIL